MNETAIAWVASVVIIVALLTQVSSCAVETERAKATRSAQLVCTERAYTHAQRFECLTLTPAPPKEKK